jgi:NIPSNAP
MIIDHRTYELQPGRVRDFLSLHEKGGFACADEASRQLVGYFTTEAGNVNEIVHIWAYQDLADPPHVVLPWPRILRGSPTCRRAENS